MGAVDKEQQAHKNHKASGEVRIMSRRTQQQMIELSAKVVSLAQANPTLSDAAIARHYGTSPATVAAILKRPHRVEPADSLDDQPTWVDRHSVNCYFCHTLFDEREGYPADELNGNDGGTACPKCFKERHKEEDEMETKTDSKGRDISKVPDSFSHHVVLYAKNWYGHSGDSIADLRALICLYAGIEPQYVPESDIYRLVAAAFAECVHNKYDIEEAILEMTGKKWSAPFERFNGTPVGAMIGKLSIVEGCYCDPSQMLKIKFEPPKQA